MGISRTVETVVIFSMLPLLRFAAVGGNGFVSAPFSIEARTSLRAAGSLKGLWFCGSSFCWHLVVSLLHFICNRRCQEIEGWVGFACSD